MRQSLEIASTVLSNTTVFTVRQISLYRLHNVLCRHSDNKNCRYDTCSTEAIEALMPELSSMITGSVNATIGCTARSNDKSTHR